MRSARLPIGRFTSLWIISITVSGTSPLRSDSSGKPKPPVNMNTMLELSMDADYDVVAACLIVAVVVAAKLWFQFQGRVTKTQDLNSPPPQR